MHGQSSLTTGSLHAVRIRLYHLPNELFMPGVDVYALLEGSTHAFLEGVLKDG